MLGQCMLIRAMTMSLLKVLLVYSLLNVQVLAKTFQDDLDYIAKVYPDAVEHLCPNIPLYGGLAALGENAVTCYAGWIHDYYNDGYFIRDTDNDGWTSKGQGKYYGPINSDVKDPVILQWTQRSTSPEGYTKRCPKSTCFFTENRSWLNHSLTQIIQFYGTYFTLKDLPLPRLPAHMWALNHEESPKNTLEFSYSDIMQLFNVTNTFRRESDYPITTQYVRSIEQIESKKWMKSIHDKNRFRKEGLAPIVYVQSDCGAPSDRDNVVQMLMKYIPIDSYGLCLHNKDLPEHLVNPVNGMDHEDFLHLISKYKFAIAMENGICKDYITEKFWRPLVLGTVPIVLGSPNILDFAPSDNSIIHVRDYTSIKELATKITELDTDDKAYELYRSFKRTGVSNAYLKELLKVRPWDTDFDVQQNPNNRKGNYVDHFDCMLCDVANEKLNGSVVHYNADESHYGCPLPVEFANEDNLSETRPFSKFWYMAWIAAECDVKAFMKTSGGGRFNYSISAMTADSLFCQARKAESIRL